MVRLLVFSFSKLSYKNKQRKTLVNNVKKYRMCGLIALITAVSFLVCISCLFHLYMYLLYNLSLKDLRPCIQYLNEFKQLKKL